MDAFLLGHGVYKHIKDSGHNVECRDVIILDREAQWPKRSIKEAIWEMIEQSINGSTQTIIKYTCLGMRWLVISLS